jgi:hypothetical protein
MTKFTKVFFAASIGIASIVAVLIQPTPVAAFTQIGDDMGKCQQKAHFKDKMCACKDSACAQVHSPAIAKKGGVINGAGKAGAANASGNSKNNE